MKLSKLTLAAGACLLVMMAQSLAQQREAFLGEAPQAPEDVSQLPGRGQVKSVTGGFTVNPASREEARSFYNAVYTSSDNVPMDSTADVSTCAPGTNSTAFNEASLRRINWFRAFAGIPASVAFDPTNSAKDQQAAVMMSRNNRLSHYPSNDWACYTTDGTNAARNSNLALGSSGADSITAYIWDYGANNNFVGHRRWLLYPQTQVMGAGDVPNQGGYAEANATWVFDSHYGGPRPATREPYVAWPPPGYVPYQVVFPRWSFAYAGANFTSATITMRSNGVPIGVIKESYATGYGENTVVWVPLGLNANSSGTVFPFGGTDTVYTVAISNIVGAPQSWYTYTVTVFDPAVPGADYFPPVITGPSQPSVGVSSAYGFTAISNATSYQWRASFRAPYSLSDGAESGSGNWDAVTSGGYGVQVAAPTYPVASGSYAFNLHHPSPPATDTLTLKQAFVATTNTLLTFKSRLTWAYYDEYATVQISTNGGSTWSDVYSQAGDGGAGETSFSLRTVYLTNLTGKVTQLRFNYLISGSYYPWRDPVDGWTFDAIVLTNAESWTLLGTNATATTNFTFNPPQAGNYDLQARALIFTEFPLDWGPAKQVTAVAASPVIVLSRPVLTNNQVWISFTLQSGSAATFKLLQADQVVGPWTTNASAVLMTNVPGVSYRYTTTPGGTVRFYRVQTP